MSTVHWAGALGPVSAGAAVVQPVEGLLRLCAVAGELRLNPAADAAAAVEALSHLARALDLADAGPPAAVVVDDPQPLRVVAVAARQEIYDSVLRPAVTALGCACSGGGLDRPADQRPGGLELRVQQALETRPDVLLVWDDGSAVVRRWQAALALHCAEARRQPAWAIPAAPARGLCADPTSLVVHGAGAVDAPDGIDALPARHVVASDNTTIATALWRELAGIWRERKMAAWPDTAPAPRLRTETLLWAARFLAAHHGVPLALFDLDLGHVAVYVVAGPEVRVHRVPLGSSHPSSFATWARGRLPSLTPEAIATLVDRHLRGIPPADAGTLDVELVLAAGRRGLLPSAPEDAWLVATGRLAACLTDPVRLGLWLLEAARPRGCGLLLWDDANALSLLAALAPSKPRAVEALLADGCIPLGGYLTSGQDNQVQLTIQLADGTTQELAVAPGEVGRVPLLRPQRIRAPAGGRAPLDDVGGPLGLLVDARPRDREATLHDFTTWSAALRAAAPARSVWPAGERAP